MVDVRELASSAGVESPGAEVRREREVSRGRGLRVCDGILEAVIYPRVTLLTAARSGWGMLTDDFHRGAGTIQLRGATVELKCSAPIPFNLDGENVAPLPVTFGVESRALRVLVP